MLFSVIYSVDTCKDIDIDSYIPNNLSVFEITEDDDCYEYNHLGGDWEGGHHRKAVAVLTREQFESFLLFTGLQAEDVETMGSLGAPGLGYGISPAISFNDYNSYSAIQSAYATPIPEVEIKCGRANREENFYRIKKAVLNLWS